MVDAHPYSLELEWLGSHTRDYGSYSREHRIHIAGKPVLTASADALFRGDAALHNPEDLLLAALSGCHLLTYLALCARARIDVTAYRDRAEGRLVLTPDGGGHFTEVVLQPEVLVSSEGMVKKALELHAAAHKYCFIANSVNFPVRHLASVRSA
jgi:organic hydroperoxide reductase OsmC/OhrA